jgi:hypothetical protein
MSSRKPCRYSQSFSSPRRSSTMLSQYARDPETQRNQTNELGTSVDMFSPLLKPTANRPAPPQSSVVAAASSTPSVNSGSTRTTVLRSNQKSSRACPDCSLYFLSAVSSTVGSGIAKSLMDPSVNTAEIIPILEITPAFDFYAPEI